VVVDMTDAGRQMTRPTKEKPAYYLPVVGGYQPKGPSIAGEPGPPPIKPLVHELAKTLAAQGYRVVEASSPPPSLLLTLSWGYITPDIADADSDRTSLDQAPTDQPFSNEKEMLSLVGGTTFENMNWFSERKAAMDAAREDRYYLLISAYDFAAARQHKKKLLRSAKVSTQRGGVTLAEVIPAFLATTGPLLGRETRVPKIASAPIAREGKVDVGTPVVAPEKK
jgi:hypothetical protein